MDAKTVRVRSPFLPVGVAMVMLSFGFTFSAGGAHWLWQSQPHSAVLLAVVGAVMIGTHVVLRVRRSSLR